MPQTQRASAFDYSSLDSETSRFVQQQTGEIRALMKRTAQDIIEVGQKLIEVKKRLRHGRFGDWLRAEFEWSEPTAQRFMRVAQQFKSVTVMDLAIAPSALYVLAAPSTPETVRTEALLRASAGETITQKLAKEIKKKHTQPPIQLPPESGNSKLKRATPPSPEPLPPQLTPSIPTQLRQRVKEPPTQKPEILAIRPSGAVQSPPAPSKETETPPPSPTHLEGVEPGFWWQLGEKHLLYCGAPNSPRFKERLPQNIALTIGFPQSPDWHLARTTEANSELAFFTRYKDLDLTLLRESLKNLLLLCTEEEETVVFSFLPDPELLLLADKLGCRCFIAEPDVRRCDEAIATWNKTGTTAQKINSIRF